MNVVIKISCIGLGVIFVLEDRVGREKGKERLSSRYIMFFRKVMLVKS